MYVEFARNVSLKLSLSSSPSCSVVKRLTPGPVSWNWAKPLQAVKSSMPERSTTAKTTTVRTKIWYVPGAIEVTRLPSSSVIVNVQFIA